MIEEEKDVSEFCKGQIARANGLDEEVAELRAALSYMRIALLSVRAKGETVGWSGLRHDLVLSAIAAAEAVQGE